MLTAQTKTGKKLCLGFDYKKETLLDLRRREEFVCPVCGETLLLKLGNHRIFHFAHKPGSNCRDVYENESFEHMEGKRQLFQWLLNQNVPSVLEYFDQVIQQRPDIMFKYKGKKYALEYQCSPLPESIFIKRTKTYLENGYIPIWIISGKHIHQKSKDKISLSNFHYLFVRSTPSGTVYIPAYYPEKQQFQIIESITPFSIKNAFANYFTFPLQKFNLDTLLEPGQSNYPTLSKWNGEKEKYILNWSLHPQPEQSSFFQEIYKHGLNLFLLPPEIGLPVSHSVLIQTPPVIWQTYLYLDVLANKNLHEFITIPEVTAHFHNRKRRKNIIIRPLPQLQSFNPIIALLEYLHQLELLGVLKQKGESKYQLQKKIFFPSSNREREEAIQRFNQQNMDVFIRR